MSHANRDAGVPAETLESCGWLAEQPPPLRRRILGCAHTRRLPAGEALYHQGDSSTGLYGIAEGSMKFSSFSQDGREVIGNVLARGAWFGELGLFDGLQRAQTATALRETVLLEIPLRSFRTLIDDDPRCTWNLASLMSRNLRASLYYNYEVLPCPPRQRITRLLHLLASDCGSRATTPFRIDIAQQQLADVAGLSRQTVNRVLRGLIADGLVSCGYRLVVLLPALFDGEEWDGIHLTSLTAGPGTTVSA